MNKPAHPHEHKPRRRDPEGPPEDGNREITEREVEDVEERSRPRTPVIYEVVRRLGEEEMRRPATSLWWSGVAAGLSISFSLLAQAILETHLPDAPWRHLVSSLGYAVGFVMVVLSRQQLFTENTITVARDGGANGRPPPQSRSHVGRRVSRQHGRDAVRRNLLHLRAGAEPGAARHDAGDQRRDDAPRLARDGVPWGC